MHKSRADNRFLGWTFTREVSAGVGVQPLLCLTWLLHLDTIHQEARGDDYSTGY